MPQEEVRTERDSAPAKILVVEDDPLIRFSMAEALREFGVCVVEAATADEAWQYLSAGGPVDLIFTDHRMPGALTGADLAHRVRREFSEVPVVVASAFLENGEWSGPTLTKPYNLFKTAADLAERALAKRYNEGDL